MAASSCAGRHGSAEGWLAALDGRAQPEAMQGLLPDGTLGGVLGERPGPVGRRGEVIEGNEGAGPSGRVKKRAPVSICG